jgi:hypothetical protein
VTPLQQFLAIYQRRVANLEYNIPNLDADSVLRKSAQSKLDTYREMLREAESFELIAPAKAAE